MLFLVVAAESSFSDGLASLLKSGDAFDSVALYVWFAGYCVAHLIVAMFCAQLAAWSDRKIAASIIAIIYLVSAINSLGCLVESIPIDGAYPLEFLGLYENYENVSRVFIVLILITMIISGIRSSGNGKRIFWGWLNLFGARFYMRLSNCTNSCKQSDSGE